MLSSGGSLAALADLSWGTLAALVDLSWGTLAALADLAAEEVAVTNGAEQITEGRS